MSVYTYSFSDGDTRSNGMVAPYLIHSPRKSKSPLSKVSCQDIHIPSHVDILAADSFEHALFIDTIRYRNEAAGFEKKGSGGHHFDARREKKEYFSSLLVVEESIATQSSPKTKD